MLEMTKPSTESHVEREVLFLSISEVVMMEARSIEGNVVQRRYLIAAGWTNERLLREEKSLKMRSCGHGASLFPRGGLDLYLSRFSESGELLQLYARSELFFSSRARQGRHQDPDVVLINSNHRAQRSMLKAQR